MTSVHPTAIVDQNAKIGADVDIGPYCVIGSGVELATGVRLHSHVVVEGRTSIGERTQVYPFASLGHVPQDLKYKGEVSRLVIGADCVIREHVTMNPGTEAGGLLTSIGNRCLIMVAVHVAHDCRIGDDVILVNNVTLAGHCSVGDHVIMAGLSGAHQFVRIGDHAFVGGMTGLENDLIPFGMAIGNRAHLAGLNLVGLKRRGFTREQIHSLRNSFKLLFSGEGNLKSRLPIVEAEYADDPNVMKIVSFIREGEDRSICTPRQGHDS
jgi:UDP-N-acetylglucosamine acyltransferase